MCINAVTEKTAALKCDSKRQDRTYYSKKIIGNSMIGDNGSE